MGCDRTHERDSFIEEALWTPQERAKYGSQMRSLCFAPVFKRTLSQHLKIGEIHLKTPSFCGFLNLKRANDPGSTLAHAHAARADQTPFFLNVESPYSRPQPVPLQILHTISERELTMIVMKSNSSRRYWAWQARSENRVLTPTFEGCNLIPNYKEIFTWAHRTNSRLLLKENKQTCSLKYTYIEGHSSKPCIKHGTSEKYVNVHIQSVKTYYTVTKTDHVAIVMFK